ncbi:MAG TPA: CPBP family intramembrane glutamic endopeptidase [Terriglobales bacterium]
MGGHERERPNTKLEANDWRWIIIAIVVAAASLWVAVRYFHRAFPEASIDFQVSGPGSAAVAVRFLQAQGLSVAGFQHAEQFSYDDQTKTFLERELGLPRTAALLGHRIQLWRWQNRWFKPLEEEEFDVDVAPSGAVVGFDHSIAAAAPGASLSEPQARALAETFVRQAMHADPGPWIAEGSEREVRAHRVDYVFTWKDAAPLDSSAPASGVVAQAEHRHVVRIQGDAVGAYREFVRVPDQWSRSYALLRSRNETTGLIDSGLILALFVALLFILVMRIRRGDIRWRLALWVGVAGAVLSLLASLNGLGAARFGYDTTQSWGAFLAGTLLSDVASAVGVGVFFVVLTAAAEALYRERFQKQIAVERFLSWRGVRSKSFLLSMVLGLALAALFFAYQTVFYLVANHLGAWAPADVPYDQLLNTRLPWAFVLFSGFFPAISEEFGFRMFALPLFEKWFRWMWVAVIAASFLWGFGHATYPNQPFYIRGVEVGLGGVLLSWVMIRFGILATVVWHYTVDAIYTAMLLLGAHDAYLRWSGAATAFMAVLPLLVAVGAYWRDGGFAPEAELTNAAQGSAPALPEAPPEAAPELPPYAPIPGPNWTTGLIVAAVLLSAFAVPMARWRTVLPWRTDARQAIAAGRRFLAQQGLDVGADRAAATLANATGSGHGDENAATAAALYGAAGPAGGPRALHRAFAANYPALAGGYWRVRYFGVLQPEEFSVAVRPDTGQVIALSHFLPQTAPGAAPPLSTAQGLAASFLAAHGLPVGAMRLQTAAQQQLPARTDSNFVWEAPAPLPGAGGAVVRAAASLAGDRISYFGAWYHVPEAQLRAFEQSTLAGTLLGVLRGMMYAAAAALVFWLLIGFARRVHLAWASLLKIAGVVGVVVLAATVCNGPAALAAYPTDTPWSAFVLSTGVGWVVAGLAGFLFTLVLLAALAVVAPHASAVTVANARRQIERDSAWDALWAALLALAWTAGWQQTRAVINARWHAGGWPVWPQPPAGLAQWAPGLADVLTAPVYALWIAAALGLLAPLLWRAWHGAPLLGTAAPLARGRWWCAAGVALWWIGIFPDIHRPAQFAAAAIFAGVSLLLVLGFAALFLRASPLAYFSAALVPLWVLPGIHWLATPAPGTALPGAVLLALAIGWLCWLAWVARGSGFAPPAAVQQHGA